MTFVQGQWTSFQASAKVLGWEPASMFKGQLGDQGGWSRDRKRKIRKVANE